MHPPSKYNNSPYPSFQSSVVFYIDPRPIIDPHRKAGLDKSYYTERSHCNSLHYQSVYTSRRAFSHNNTLEQHVSEYEEQEHPYQPLS
jgi:hypothetical protein